MRHDEGQAPTPYRALPGPTWPDTITLVRARPSCEYFCLTKQLPKCGKFEYLNAILTHRVRGST